MFYEKIIFDGDEINVTDYCKYEISLTDPFNSTKSSRNWYLSITTDNKKWFETLIEGNTYSIGYQNNTACWLLNEKNETEELNLEFSLITSPN